MNSFVKNIKVLTHHLTPKYILTRIAGLLADQDLGSITTCFIKAFIKKYHIDMQEALKENPQDYHSFNEFFTRVLKPNARPIDNETNVVVMPVDGTMAEFGSTKYDRLIAAKGQDYSLKNLLGGGEDYKDFSNGDFACIYLSPSNYHRIHMPIDGTLKKMIYIPGKFYSVNPTYVEAIDELFTKNERVVCFFDTSAGPLAMVLVGATIVGSIATTWAGVITPQNKRKLKVWDYSNLEQPVNLKKGEEMGKFLLGSTVITCFGPNKISFIPELKTNHPVKLGTKLANITIDKTQQSTSK